MADKGPDFVAQDHGSIWSIVAVSKAAEQFAAENFAPEGWQGRPDNFTTDWRAGRDLAERLMNEGWQVAAR